jgi:hypothetical protein
MQLGYRHLRYDDVWFDIQGFEAFYWLRPVDGERTSPETLVLYITLQILTQLKIIILTLTDASTFNLAVPFSDSILEC